MTQVSGIYVLYWTFVRHNTNSSDIDFKYRFPCTNRHDMLIRVDIFSMKK